MHVKSLAECLSGSLNSAQLKPWNSHSESFHSSLQPAVCHGCIFTWQNLPHKHADMCKPFVDRLFFVRITKLLKLAELLPARQCVLLMHQTLLLAALMSC